MAQTLEYNGAVTGVAPVPVQAFEDDLDIIQKLDDEPNDVGGLTAAQLKETFDQAGNQIKQYINNELIPAVLADGLTEETRANAEAERVTNEQERVSNENARIEAEKRRVDETTGVVAQAGTAARSWAEGGTGTREGENTNNAKYWSEQARQIAGDGVTSFNGRSGAVMPQTGDYTPAMVGAAAVPVYVASTMLASGWTGNTYSFEADYPHEQYNIEVAVADTATAEQFDAAGAAKMGSSATRNVFTARGDVPTVDIPVIVKAVKK